jgi:hypothetical protein
MGAQPRFVMKTGLTLIILLWSLWLSALQIRATASYSWRNPANASSCRV